MDFTATLTVRIPFTARNAEQADERAELLERWLKWEPPKNRPWAEGDGWEVESVEVEEV